MAALDGVLPALIGAAGAAGGSVEVTNSLRFNPGDSPTLSKTFGSAGDRRTWTYSCWVKRTTNFNSYRHTLASGPGSTLSFSETAQGGADSWFFYVDATPYLLSDEVLRDTSSWYHAVFVFDTTNSTQADRCRVYKNGVRVTSWRNTAYPALNFEGNFNTAGVFKVGCGNSNEFLDGYMADVHFIDGQALDPTEFGAFDSDGVWQIAEYTGTYGGNGFRLAFDNSTNLGKDSSGNNNDFTASNFSVTPGAGNDLLFDVPKNGTQSDTGAGGEVSGNYCVLNPLDTKLIHSNGNLDATASTSQTWVTGRGTMAMPSGKFYWEVTINSLSTTSDTAVQLGIGALTASLPSNDGAADSNAFVYLNFNGKKMSGGSEASYGASYTTGDVIGVAFDADAGTLVFYKNGSSQGTAYSSLDADKQYAPLISLGRSSTSTSISVNFGQRPWAYSAPSNHKALCTTNLPTPTIADGSDYFDTKLWTGNGSTQSITGLEFNPDWVWIKNRNGGHNHMLFDIVRGTGADLQSNSTATEGAAGSNDLTSFDSNGFSLGSNNAVNQSGRTFVAWAWDAGSSTVSNTDGSITTSLRANAAAGFSIATYSGSGTNGDTIGHGLGVQPDFVIVKARNKSDDWRVYHSALGTGYIPALNSTTVSTGANWQSISNTTLGLQNDSAINGSGYNYVAYFFAAVEGYSAFGEYDGNGSSDGPFLYTGHRPAWIMVKCHNASTSSTNWIIWDTARDSFNMAEIPLRADLGDQEIASSDNYDIDILSNGFKIRTSNGGINHGSRSYVFASFAENPFQSNGGLAR